MCKKEISTIGFVWLLLFSVCFGLSGICYENNFSHKSSVLSTPHAHQFQRQTNTHHSSPTKSLAFDTRKLVAEIVEGNEHEKQRKKLNVRSILVTQNGWFADVYCPSHKRSIALNSLHNFGQLLPLYIRWCSLKIPF